MMNPANEPTVPDDLVMAELLHRSRTDPDLRMKIELAAQAVRIALLENYIRNSQEVTEVVNEPD